ncbi:hypothetical protein C475_18923 [Halosimplex carlsbadense 2-9-1]|uniref:Uncharacterized protein n=1 Tax=Halosimplex carlsbadense 2-9-1 TaxID=797114 RepID=M0CCR7_9EURY|nr:hypothetical protein [Halosimplex carlsbadense]ELZ21061.1 hypothetical protein C475_18923 [Halosimplex carlsbadense 2-9-1]
MAGELAHVPFDIETTGLGAADEVTVVGFGLDLGCRVFYQTGGRPHDGCESAVKDRADELVKVSAHRSEAVLLEAVSEFVAQRLRSDDVLLVAYNGETWRGGFDLPFLRTRFAAHDLQWPFEDVPYADLLPVVRDLFNTVVDGDDAADLDTAYEVLCDGAYDEFDPFEDSAEAVSAFEDGRFEDVVLHNVSDVFRTERLSMLAQRG